MSAAEVVGSSEHELSVAQGARVLVIDAVSSLLQCSLTCSVAQATRVKVTASGQCGLDLVQSRGAKRCC